MQHLGVHENHHIHLTAALKILLGKELLIKELLITFSTFIKKKPMKLLLIS